jgi:S-methylmethionine-dependent homocysteine/selenocysteine methylase
MTAGQAAADHRPQIQSFADAGADMITVLTITYADEAAEIILAATEAGVPVMAGLTVETNGDLPSGQSLAAAIERIDGVTRAGPRYYMISCARPRTSLTCCRPRGPGPAAGVSGPTRQR